MARIDWLGFLRVMFATAAISAGSFTALILVIMVIVAAVNLYQGIPLPANPLDPSNLPDFLLMVGMPTAVNVTLIGGAWLAWQFIKPHYEKWSLWLQTLSQILAWETALVIGVCLVLTGNSFTQAERWLYPLWYAVMAVFMPVIILLNARREAARRRQWQ